MTKSPETVSVSLTRDEWRDVKMSLLVNAGRWAEYGAKLEDELRRSSHYRISNGLVDLCASIEDQSDAWDGTTAEDPSDAWDGTTAEDQSDAWDGTTAEDTEECMSDDELVSLFAKCLRDTYRDAKGL